MNTLKILIPSILAVILVKVLVFLVQSYFIGSEVSMGFVGIFVVAVISWMATAFICYLAVKKIVIDKPVSNNSQKYYRFYRSIILGATIVILSYAVIIVAIFVIAGELAEIGGGDTMTLIAGYLGGRQAAKKLLPESEVPKTRWL